AEQLDALVEALRVLETSPADADQLNEAFRLIHSIKGSSAMMGLDGITVLTHHLENHFERLRSGLVELDQPSMGLILRCIDFLRECNSRLRAGSAPAPAPELPAGPAAPTKGSAPSARIANSAAEDSSPPEAPATEADVPIKTPAASADGNGAPSLPVRDYLVTVRFEADLALVDLKAELVLSRLSEIGTVR